MTAGHKTEDVDLREQLRQWVVFIVEREKKHYPDQKDFAHAIGIHPARLNRIISGKRPVTIDVLARIRGEFYDSIDEMVKHPAPGVEMREKKLG